MANIRVKCPTCQTDLEIDAEFEGQEVECGNCLQVFVAKSASSSSSGSRKTPGSSRGRRSDDDAEEERPKKKKKKRRRDDDDYDHDYDDDDDYYGPPASSGGSNALGIVSLVLGILSVVIAIATVCCCPFVAVPFSLGAIITGLIGMGNPESKGMAIGGLITGILSLGICLVILILTGFQMQQNPNQFR